MKRKVEMAVVFGFDGDDLPRVWAQAARLEEAVEECEKQACAYIHEKAALGARFTIRLFQQRSGGRDDLHIKIGS